MEAPRRTLRIEQSPLEKARLWAEIAAFTAAGCWAVYTFVYQTRIAPAWLPAHENIAVSVQRLASTTSQSIQRVQLAIRNDGTVDVDTAALAVNVAGAAPSKLRWARSASTHAFELHDPDTESWHALQSYAELWGGATGGRRGSHIVLRPGDSVDFELLVPVPREDKLLRVSVDTIYGRYPIEPRIPARLKHLPGGGMDFSAHHSNVDFTDYFGV